MKARADFSVLVVDDEEMLRETIAFEMEMLGFKVFSAASATSALEIVQENKIDLVLSDIRMPDGDGIFLLETLRKIHPDMPVVILVTGFSDVSVETCLEKGARQVITKPFPRDLLIQNVLSALEIRP